MELSRLNSLRPLSVVVFNKHLPQKGVREHFRLNRIALRVIARKMFSDPFSGKCSLTPFPTPFQNKRVREHLRLKCDVI